MYWFCSKRNFFLRLINAPTYVWGGVQGYSVTAPVVFTVPLTNACSFTNNATFKGNNEVFFLIVTGDRFFFQEKLFFFPWVAIALTRTKQT
jgi:hypothetical protein